MFTACLPTPHLPWEEELFCSGCSGILAPQTVPIRRRYLLHTCWMNKWMKRLSKQDSENTIRRRVLVFCFGKETGFGKKKEKQKWDLGQWIRKRRIPNSWQFYGDFNKQTEDIDTIQGLQKYNSDLVLEKWSTKHSNKGDRTVQSLDWVIQVWNKRKT